MLGRNTYFCRSNGTPCQGISMNTKEYNQNEDSFDDCRLRKETSWHTAYNNFTGKY